MFIEILVTAFKVFNTGQFLPFLGVVIRGFSCWVASELTPTLPVMRPIP